MTIGTYTLGPCKRPLIKHDNGFLDQFARRAPTVTDHLQYQWWVGKMEAAEAAQKVPFMPHNDLSDALAAYRHFLNGTGKDRTFSYERYVANDPSGAITLKNAITDASQGAWALWKTSQGGKTDLDFELTSSAFSASSGSARFPYPQTENWQKAIGAHYFWLCATIHVSGDAKLPRFEMDLTLHAEDMYNFNPGAHDIATGIPDAANGIFEITGLAKQYRNISELARHVSWSGMPSAAMSVTPTAVGRARQPSDNRRLRNRT